MSLVLVIGTLAWSSATKDDPVDKKATSAPKNEALVLVAEFAPDPKSAEAYRVTETIHQKLDAAFAQYRDVRVASLGRALTAQDGSQTARAEGKRRGATIVIWGWYGRTKTTVALSVHFELLEALPSYLAPTLGPQSKGQVRKEPLQKLESFVIQEDLSSELLYFSEISVGLIRLFQEDADGAISHLTGALNVSDERSSARSEVRFHRGIAYMHKSLRMPSRRSAKAPLQKASADFSEVIKREPSLHAPSYSNRGQIYRDLGEYDRSVEDYNHAIRLTPDYGNYLGRALTYARIPDYTKAIADVSHAIKLEPSAQNFEERGVIYAAKRDKQLALMDFDKAIQLKPMANTYTHRSIVLTSIGRMADALDDLNRAIELEPTHADWYHNRGAWYLDGKNWDAAIADFTKAIALGGNDDALSGYYLQRGLAHYFKGDSDKAIGDFNSVLDRAAGSDMPNIDSIAVYSRGLAFEQKREWTSAMNDYTAAIQTNPKAIKAYLRRGMLHFRQGEDTKAIADLSGALKLDPDNAQALLDRARVYTNLEDYSRALSDVNRGIRITNDPVFFLGRAGLMTATGHRAQAIKDLRHVIVHSRDPQLRETAESRLKELNPSGSP